MKTKNIYIDADHIVYFVAYSNKHMSGFEKSDKVTDGDDFGITVKESLKPYKKHFKEIVNEYIKIAEVESIAYNWNIGETFVVMSDKTNFRFKVFPEYKNKRTEQSEIFYGLRAWARKNYMTEENTEADDVCSCYARKGHLVFTTDKDVFKGNYGTFYNAHHQHRCWVYTTKEDAEHFFKCQVLAGDNVDGIPSLPRVGIATAEKLLTKHGDSWNDILSIFESKGFDKKYMTTMARLVCMTQWSPKKGIKLWKFPKKLTKNSKKD